MVRLKLKRQEPLEKDIQAVILNYLQYNKDVFCWKEHSGGIPINNGKSFMPIGLTGKSDIIGIYKGRFLAIEVKRPSGKLSENQINFINKINAHGGLAFMATSVDDLISRGL